MTHEEWKAKAVELFGSDPMQWKFRCPVCKFVASVADYKAAGAPEDAVAFSCIGRYSEAKRDAFGLNPQKIKRGELPPDEGDGPCNYAGGGLFQLNPVKVEYQGKTHSMFDFAL